MGLGVGHGAFKKPRGLGADVILEMNEELSLNRLLPENDRRDVSYYDKERGEGKRAEERQGGREVRNLVNGVSFRDVPQEGEESPIFAGV